jgi:hypothetical protein
MALNHFSHYKNSQAARGKWEVVSPALFEVYFKFPNILSYDSNDTLLMFEHVRSITGLDGVAPTIGNVVQKYKFAERHYAAAGPDKTSLELTITFTMNLKDTHENYIYNMLRKWYHLVYNPQNGQTLTKNQYATGSILEIVEHDRDGSIWRTIKCLDFFPSTPPTGLNDDNYDSMGDAKTVSITFLVDDWVEKSIGMLDYRDISSGEINENYYEHHKGVYLKKDINNNSNNNNDIYDEIDPFGNMA